MGARKVYGLHIVICDAHVELHVSGIADPFNGHIEAFRIAHVQRSDGWIETTCNNMSSPGAFAAAETQEQQGGEPPPLGVPGWSSV